MTAPNDRFNRNLATWLDSEAEAMAPGWLHEAAMAKAIRTRQRAGWVVRLRGPLGGAEPLRGREQLTLRLVVVLGLLVLLGALVWLVGSQPVPPSPIRNGQILVARATGGPIAKYYTMNADGSGERLLFDARDCGQCAFWSPDGRWIIYPETSNGRLLTAVVRADGAAKVVLQPLPDSTVNLGPGGWSADGSLIALAGWDDTDPSRRGIYVATPEGTGLRQVSRSLDGRPQDWPAFSPDGSKVLFMSIDDVGPRQGGQAGDLMVVNLDGTDQRRLNPKGTKVVATTRTGRPMDWSPDGDQIAFAAIEGDLDAGRSAVFLVPSTGGEPVRITDPEEWTSSLDWAPHGNSVLAGDTTGGHERIWTVDAATKERRELWTSTADERACCGTWSPDGSLILFQRGPGGRRDLWTMRPDGTVQSQVTRLPADYVWYSWARAPG
jgi:Tol biopolymer transport system component